MLDLKPQWNEIWKNCNVRIGDLVHVKSDGNKHTARDKYIVSEINTDYLFAKRLYSSETNYIS